MAMFGIIDNADYFRPQDTVTRAEMLKIIGNAAGWDVSGAGGTFPANSPESDLNDTDFEDLFPTEGTDDTGTGTGTTGTGTGGTSTGMTSTGSTGTGGTSTGSTGTGETGTGMSSTGSAIFDLFNLAPELLKISAETSTGTDYGTGQGDMSDTGLEDIFPTGTLDSATPATATNGGASVTGGNSGFQDVSPTAWYAPYVSYAVSNGIVSPGTSFRPNDPVTRAEAAKMIVNALGRSVSTDTDMLSDFEKTLSLAPYIQTAKENGIFPGLAPDGSSTFRPNDPMDRAEIARAIVKAWGL